MRHDFTVTVPASDNQHAGVPRQSGAKISRASRVPGGPFVTASGPERLTLGHVTGGEVRGACVDNAAAAVVFGSHSSGAGPLQDSLVAQQIARQGAYVLLDVCLDHERQDALAYSHRQAGTLADFHVLNGDDPAASHTYNPLLRGTARAAAERLFACLHESREASTPACTNDAVAAVSWLALLIQALRERDEVASCSSLHEALTATRAFASLANAPQLSSTTRASLVQWLGEHAALEDGVLDLDRVTAPFASMLRMLSNFATGKLGQVLNAPRPDIDLADILRSRKGLHVMLPVMGKDRTALALGRLITADIAASLREDTAQPPGITPPAALVVLLEAPAYCEGELENLFGAAREAGCSVIACATEVRHLSVMCEADRNAILENCQTKVFFRAGARENPEELRSFGAALASMGASPALPDVLARLSTTPPGKGFVVRGTGLTSFEVWPQNEIHPEIESYEVPQRAKSP